MNSARAAVKKYADAFEIFYENLTAAQIKLTEFKKIKSEEISALQKENSELRERLAKLTLESEAQTKQIADLTKALSDFENYKKGVEYQITTIKKENELQLEQLKIKGECIIAQLKQQNETRIAEIKQESEQRIKELIEENTHLNKVLHDLQTQSIRIDQMKCSITFDDPPTTALGCGHPFCDKCVKDLLAKNQPCPKCRTPITQIIKLFF